MKKISILGSTGSIGTQTLDVINQHQDIEVLALAAHSNISLLEKQIRQFHPRLVAVWDEEKAIALKNNIKDINCDVEFGPRGLIDVACIDDAQLVVGATVGTVGIEAILSAIRNHKDIALANKETLVCAGDIIMNEARDMGIHILPVDSEHSAIFQCLQGQSDNHIYKIWLTASGGAFRGYNKDQLSNIKVKDALTNPNWHMGAKVTIDSSTMVNKGLEMIEAMHLFDISIDDIEVVIQPQSIVHSMVEFDDGAIIAQIGIPDMRIPIQYALYYPYRYELNSKRITVDMINDIRFEKPDLSIFKGTLLAYHAAKEGGSMPTVFNTADEEAVKLFIDGYISWLDIYDVIDDAMNHHDIQKINNLEDIFETIESTKNYIRGIYR